MPHVRLRRQSFPVGQPASLLSLTGNIPVDQILGNIPFLALGLTALAVFTFFLLVRRSNLLAVYLYAAILFAFIGSTLDLATILPRASDRSSNGSTFDPNAAIGLVAAREICFGLSIGFRYIFLWGFVALAPRERSSPDPDSESIQSFQLSGQREEWVSFQGLKALLKWGLLLVAASIPIFQIIWRLSGQGPGFYPIYLTSITLEIVAATGMILQMTLTSLVSTGASSASLLRSYSAPIIALLLALGVCVGGLIIINFSETILGRFIQAMVFYILVVFVMVVAFRQRRQPQPSRPHGEKVRPSAGDFVPPPRVEAAMQAMDAVRRQSMTRLSSWMAVRHLSLTTPSNEALPQQTESGDTSRNSLKPPIATRPPAGSHSPSMVDMELALGSPDVESTSFSITKPHETRRSNTGVSVPSYYYRNFSDGGFTLVNDSTDSPIYGLHGIIQQSRPALDQPVSRPPSEGMSLEALLLEQRELDNSIAALRLLSPRSSLQPLPQADQPVSGVPRDDNRSSLKRSSTSARSEFSLSNFPAPPDVTDNGAPATTSVTRGNAPIRFKGAHVRERTLSSQPSSIDRLLPPNALKDHRFDSNGTQYDVTSFIGGLSGPDQDGEKQDSSLLEVVHEETGNTPPSSAASIPPASPRLDQGLSPSPIDNEVAPGEPATPMIDHSTPRYQPSLRPLLLGSGAPAPFVPHSQVPVGSRARALVSRPRPMISGPRLLLLDSRGEPGEFEQPRKPPGRPVSR